MFYPLFRVVGILWRIIKLGFGLAFFFLCVQSSTFSLESLWHDVSYRVSAHHFDFIQWEIAAIARKAGQTLFGVHPFMDEAARSQFVRDYMADLATAQRLEAEIDALYTRPDVGDPARASAALRDQRDSLRASLAERQLLAEAILEGQVAAILVEEGFGVAGQLWPPMAMHFSPVPNLLIVSPRDRISFDVALNLNPMGVDRRAAIEAHIEAIHDVSALIVPIGGIAVYPAMIQETTSIPWALETFAHEWLHHYLFFHPLGLDYFTGGEAFAGQARIINETVADTFGKEVGQLAVARYYPDLLAPAPQNGPANPVPLALQRNPLAFDFGREMNRTRVNLDLWLAKGDVTAAEIYLEARRRLFVANGYPIRRLNQAYFAFYGGYQAGGIPGVGGEDPIGPAVRDIRRHSPSLRAFVLNVQGVTTREQLLGLRDALAPKR